MTQTEISLAASSVAPKAAAGKQRARSLYTPLTDFLLLGGGFFVILPLLALLPEPYVPPAMSFFFWLQLLINFPHFTHSYQIFYRDFGSKLRGDGYTRGLSYRYIFAGLVVPVIMVGIFAASSLAGSKQAMGACASAMTFFVGWHYVKQGYGMLIVDSVLKKHFFDDVEKRIFRSNAYACWVFFFLLTSHIARQKDFFGLKYYYLDVPYWLLATMFAVMAGTTVIAGWAALRAHQRMPGATRPVTGYVAYFASLYVWLCALFSPLVVFAVPAFHSLQYLAVVYRFEINRDRGLLAGEGEPTNSHRLWVRFAIFVGIGIILGALVFFLIPYYLNANMAYDKDLFGGTLFTFIIWIFINVHHYFLDNVMWRKDNPDVRAHLFAT